MPAVQTGQLSLGKWGGRWRVSRPALQYRTTCGEACASPRYCGRAASAAVHGRLFSPCACIVNVLGGTSPPFSGCVQDLLWDQWDSYHSTCTRFTRSSSPSVLSAALRFPLHPSASPLASSLTSAGAHACVSPASSALTFAPLSSVVSTST